MGSRLYGSTTVRHEVRGPSTDQTDICSGNSLHDDVWQGIRDIHPTEYLLVNDYIIEIRVNNVNDTLLLRTHHGPFLAGHG